MPTTVSWIKERRSGRLRSVPARLVVGVVAVLLGAAAVAVPAQATSPPPSWLGSAGAARPTDQASASDGVLLAEAKHEFTTMTATRYQHHNVEDAVAGTYFYDCVGFVTYALGQAAPTARTTIMTKFSIAAGRVPAPGKYVQLFNQLDGTQAGWSPVHRVADLLPGDVVAWSYAKSTSSNETGSDHASRGHAFVVATAPQADGANSFVVQVWDSTATPHGPNDTRLTNPKNLAGPNGKPSGLGTGTVRLDANADGALGNVHWSPTSKTVAAAQFGTGRPTS